jgi:hypothetical protein
MNAVSPTFTPWGDLKVKLAFAVPWAAFFSVLFITAFIRNTNLDDNAYFSWIVASPTLTYFLYFLGATWLVCRLYIIFIRHIRGFRAIASVSAIGVSELLIAFLFLVVWGILMIGGPINPG